MSPESNLSVNTKDFNLPDPQCHVNSVQCNVNSVQCNVNSVQCNVNSVSAASLVPVREERGGVSLG